MPSQPRAIPGDAVPQSRSALAAESGTTTRACRSPIHRPWMGAALVGVIAFAVYVRTLASTIVWGDSPELTAAAYTGGVPHPTGYPLYMLLAHDFIHLVPVGSAAYRMNLLTAISAALAIALIYPLMLRISRCRISSLTGALLFAFSLTFWSQAVIAEVYAFQMLCTAAVLGCVLAWEKSGERRWLFASMFGYGLCFTHHMMSVLMAPGLLYFALTSPHRRQFIRELPRTIPLALLPLCLYAYLPLAAHRNPPLNWNDPSNWENFLRHVSGRQYRPAMFHMKGAQLWSRLLQYVGLKSQSGFDPLPAQFYPGLLWLAPVGAWSLARRRPRLFGLTFLLYVVDVAYALNYLVPDVDVYYLPSHLMVAIWIARGTRELLGRSRRFWRRVAPAPARARLSLACATGLLAMPLLPLTAHWAENDRHNDFGALEYAHATLATVKPNAVLFGEGDFQYFPLLYARYVEQYRPDVTMLEQYDVLCPARLRLTSRWAGHGLTVHVPSCFQHGHRGGVRDHNCLLKQLIRDNIDRRPVYVLGPPDLIEKPWLGEAIAPYCRLIASDLSRIELTRQPPPLAANNARPERPERVGFGQRGPDGRVTTDLELLGCDVEPAGQGESRVLEMSYYWKIRRPAAARSARVWVLFTDSAGNYQRKEDGSPEYHNIHPLAYGLGSSLPRLPTILRETYRVYAPATEPGRRWHVRIAVAQGDRFLATGKRNAPWIELGELPGPPVRTAAAPGRAPLQSARWSGQNALSGERDR